MKQKLIKTMCAAASLAAALYVAAESDEKQKSETSAESAPGPTNTITVKGTNTAPIKLQSKPVVYIIPKMVIVHTPQATLMWCDEHHIQELAKLGYRAYVVTNWSVTAP